MIRNVAIAVLGWALGVGLVLLFFHGANRLEELVRRRA